jgi:PhnB protein
MPTINPYLNFYGNTEEAFNFYKDIFGGKFLALQRFKDFPEGDKLSDTDREKIMHISLPISKGYILMGTDTLESMGQTLTVGNNFYISVQVETKEEADRVFKELSAGGKMEMPIQDTFWGAYFGMFADKFGIQWMINFDYPDEK